jgi:hypothetical protein
MPANLPPQYFEAEKRFRTAKSPLEKIAALEEMMAIMPKHKGTDHLRAELRSRMAKLTQLAAKKSGTQRASMAIEKEGPAQIAVIGLPNSGKSQLVATITNASPAIAEYPITTHSATPGMMEFENIKIQLIDTPPLPPQPGQWWLPPMLRQADALLVMVDLSDNSLAKAEANIVELLKMKIVISKANVEVEPEVILWPKKALIIGSKMDLDRENKDYQALLSKYKRQLPVAAISTKEGTGLEELRLIIYKMLDIIRVYTKMPGKKADLADPVVLKKGSTLNDAAISIHKDFGQKLKYARIWGSGKHDGIMAKRDHILQDSDVIELHL